MKDRKYKDLSSYSPDKIFTSKYGKIIAMVDELTSLGCFDSGFSMPVQRFAFIGDTGAGKTTLIDSLLGYDFLPRETPTKRIVEIKVVHNTEIQTPYIEFNSDSIEQKRILNFKDAKEIIKNLQLNTTNQTLSEPIKVVLTTPSSAEMVLFDTPAIDDKQAITKEMIVNTIRDSGVLIILVMSAMDLLDENVLTRDKWFQLVNLYDYDKSRTICTFTKVDLLPSRFNWPNMKKYLKDTSDPRITDVIPLKYGYLCLKMNYSSGVSSNELSHFEKEYFTSHKVLQFYSVNEYFTIDTLCERISKYIFDLPYFRRKLSEIYEKLKDRIESNQKEMRKFGTDHIVYNSANKEVYLQSLLNMFCESVDRIFSGKAENKDDNIANSNLKKQYMDFLINDTGYQPSKTFKSDEIIKTLQRQEGVHLSGFPNGDVIYSLLQDEISRLREDVKIYHDNVYTIINTVIKDLIMRIFGRFPKALSQFEDLVQAYLDKEFAKTRDIMNSIAEMNFNYLYIDEQSRAYQEVMENNMLKGFMDQNPNNPNRQGQGQMQGQMQGQGQGQWTDNQSKVNQSNPNMMKPQNDISFFKSAKDKDVYYKGLADYVKVLVDYIYSQIVRNLREYIPKATGNFYVKSLKTNMRYFLLSKVTKDPEFIENLEEDEEQATKRKYYIDSTKRLKKISKEISYDDNLMKMIKGESSKNIETIVQQQLKVESSSTSSTNINKTSSNQGSYFSYQGNKKAENQPKVDQNPSDSKGFFSNIFSSNSNKQAQEQSQQKPPPVPQTKTEPSTTSEKTQSQNPQGKGLDINFKFDPKSNQVKDVNVEGQMDVNTIKQIYQNNKQYLPTGAQIMSGMKTVYTATTQMIEKMDNTLSSQQQQGKQQQQQQPPAQSPKKSKDPLTNLFGVKKK